LEKEMGSINVAIDIEKFDTTEVVNGGHPRGNVQKIINVLRGLISGAAIGKVTVNEATANHVAASGTLTLVSVIATDVIAIGPVTFTFTSTPTLETDIEVDGASDTLDAAAAVAAINLHSTVGSVVTATNVAGVITLTARDLGVVGNFMDYGSVDSTITAAGAHLTAGTGGTSASPAITLERQI
jgi:hypothetical protein